MRFTQYLLPNGRPVAVEIDRSPEVEALASELVKAGYKFEIEVLMTGDISMTIESGNEDDMPLAMEICHNGPTEGDRLGVPESVDKMVREAAKAIKVPKSGKAK